MDRGTINGLTIAELSKLSGVPVRTVRFYQSQELLPRPDRAGREVRYNDAHLERLNLIGELQDRGLQLSAIREIVKRAGTDPSSLAEWFGLDKSLWRPWTEDRPVLGTAAEINALVAREVPFELLEQFGLIERRRDTSPETYLVPSLALLEIGFELADLGIPIEFIVDARRIMDRRLARLADELVERFTEDLDVDRLTDEGLSGVGELVERLRPIAQRAVSVAFAHQMERSIRDIAKILVALREADAPGRPD